MYQMQHHASDHYSYVKNYNPVLCFGGREHDVLAHSPQVANLSFDLMLVPLYTLIAICNRVVL